MPSMIYPVLNLWWIVLYMPGISWCLLITVSDVQSSVIFKAEGSIRDDLVTRVQTCALPIYCPFLVAAAPPLFILSNSRCGTAPDFYTARFSLRQRPPLFILTGSAMNFLLPGSPCGSTPAFYTAHLSLRQRPLFL